MSQTYQPKDIILSMTFSGAGAVATTQSAYPVVGELLEVTCVSFHTGSVYVTESGTSRELWRNNAPSGTLPTIAYPRAFGQITTGSIAGATMFPFNANGPLILNAGSMASGTSPLTVTLRYR